MIPGTLFARARAAKLLRDRERVTIDRWLGVTGGVHVIRDDLGRVWSVDLVCSTVALNVGTMPEGWKHPPRNE